MLHQLLLLKHEINGLTEYEWIYHWKMLSNGSNMSLKTDTVYWLKTIKTLIWKCSFKLKFKDLTISFLGHKEPFNFNISKAVILSIKRFCRLRGQGSIPKKDNCKKREWHFGFDISLIRPLGRKSSKNVFFPHLKVLFTEWEKLLSVSKTLSTFKSAVSLTLFWA